MVMLLMAEPYVVKFCTRRLYQF